MRVWTAFLPPDANRVINSSPKSMFSDNFIYILGSRAVKGLRLMLCLRRIIRREVHHGEQWRFPDLLES